MFRFRLHGGCVISAVAGCTTIWDCRPPSSSLNLVGCRRLSSHLSFSPRIPSLLAPADFPTILARDRRLGHQNAGSRQNKVVDVWPSNRSPLPGWSSGCKWRRNRTGVTSVRLEMANETPTARTQKTKLCGFPAGEPIPQPPIFLGSWRKSRARHDVFICEIRPEIA